MSKLPWFGEWWSNWIIHQKHDPVSCLPRPARAAQAAALAATRRERERCVGILKAKRKVWESALERESRDEARHMAAIAAAELDAAIEEMTDE